MGVGVEWVENVEAEGFGRSGGFGGSGLAEVGGKEEEMEVGRRREEGFINVSWILMHCCVLFIKARFMSNEHNMIVINQPMLSTY